MKVQFSPDHPETLRCANNLAQAYVAIGQLGKAIPLHEETLQKNEARLGGDDPQTLNSMHNLARAYFQQPNYAKAEPLLVAWLAKQRPKLPANNVDLAVNFRLLGECRVALKKFAEAEPPLRESLALIMKAAPKSVLFLASQSALGAALAGQKKHTEAETLLVGSAKVFIKVLAGAPHELSPSGKEMAVQAVVRVIDYYVARGNSNEADQWRRRLAEAAKGTSLKIRK
jgi:tetratricopeptide (TPR) repeat protein